MTKKRYALLMDDLTTQLTQREWKAGWHFCFDFDGLLVGPGMGEQQACECFQETHDNPKRPGHKIHIPPAPPQPGVPQISPEILDAELPSKLRP